MAAKRKRGDGERQKVIAPCQTYECRTWEGLKDAWRAARTTLAFEGGEEVWYRGVRQRTFSLSPSLHWSFAALSDPDLDQLERHLFFEFQARARELHERGLSDWDYLFFMRHHGVPTRILDWTDSFGIALYFALESPAAESSPAGDAPPCLWMLNPYALNERTWKFRDLIQPKYLGHVDEEFWEYGELLQSEDDWQHDGPVAVYPLQISERMRAQRGWFTVSGNLRQPLEVLHPQMVARIDLHAEVIAEAREFLTMAGIRPYRVYPDLDHLGSEIVSSNLDWVTAASTRAGKSARPSSQKGEGTSRARKEGAIE